MVDPDRRAYPAGDYPDGGFIGHVKLRQIRALGCETQALGADAVVGVAWPAMGCRHGVTRVGEGARQMRADKAGRAGDDGGLGHCAGRAQA